MFYRCQFSVGTLNDVRIYINPDSYKSNAFTIIIIIQTHIEHGKHFDMAEYVL
jgi:hypothetical protein